MLPFAYGSMFRNGGRFLDMISERRLLFLEARDGDGEVELAERQEPIKTKDTNSNTQGSVEDLQPGEETESTIPWQPFTAARGGTARSVCSSDKAFIHDGWCSFSGEPRSRLVFPIIHQHFC